MGHRCDRGYNSVPFLPSTFRSSYFIPNLSRLFPFQTKLLYQTKSMGAAAQQTTSITDFSPGLARQYLAYNIKPPPTCSPFKLFISTSSSRTFNMMTIAFIFLNCHIQNRKLPHKFSVKARQRRQFKRHDLDLRQGPLGLFIHDNQRGSKFAILNIIGL